jgi:hypothetical protein
MPNGYCSLTRNVVHKFSRILRIRGRGMNGRRIMNFRLEISDFRMKFFVRVLEEGFRMASEFYVMREMQGAGGDGIPHGD